MKTLVGCLADLGHSVEVWNEHSLSDTESTDRVQPSGHLGGVPFEYVLGTVRRGKGFRSVGTKLKAVRCILDRLRREPSDVVILNNLSFYDTYPISRCVAGQGGISVQCYEDERLELLDTGSGGLAGRVFGLNAWLCDRLCSDMADSIWVISSYLKRKYAGLSGRPGSIHIVPTIVDCSAWRDLPPPETDPVRFLYSGAFGPQDELAPVVRAFPLLVRRGFDPQLVLAGAEPGRNALLDATLALAKECGVEERVRCIGFLKHEDLKREIGRATVLINLRQESIWSVSGLSTKLSEYLAAGRVVLTTDIGDNASYVVDAESAIVVGPGAGPEDLAARLAPVLASEELRRKLGAGARRAAEVHFDRLVVRERLGSILSGLVGGRS